MLYCTMNCKLQVPKYRMSYRCWTGDIQFVCSRCCFTIAKQINNSRFIQTDRVPLNYKFDFQIWHHRSKHRQSFHDHVSDFLNLLQSPSNQILVRKSRRKKVSTLAGNNRLSVITSQCMIIGYQHCKHKRRQNLVIGQSQYYNAAFRLQ